MRLGEADLRVLRDMTREGKTAKEIASSLGCSTTTITNWWAKFKEAGVNLQQKPGPRPMDLTKLND